MPIIQLPETIRRWETLMNPVQVFEQHGIGVELQVLAHPETQKPEVFFAFTKKPGLTVCPVTEEGNFILIAQFKQAVQRVVIEFPAGTLNEDEDSLDGANRELSEETGYHARNIIKTSPEMIFGAPRKSRSGFETFLAIGCKRVEAQELDPGETDIHVLEVSPTDLGRAIASGEIRSAETSTALLNAILSNSLPSEIKRSLIS